MKTGIEASTAVKRLVDAVADWQYAACRGRPGMVLTRMEKARRAARDLLTALAGTEPPEEEIDAVLANVGAV